MSRKPGVAAYSDADKERAFLVWLLEGDRNAAKTARILAQRHPNEPNPSDQTIRNWDQAEQWDVKAQEYFAQHAPAMYHRFHGRIAAQYDRLLTWQDALMDPNHPDHERLFGQTPQVEVNKMRAKLAPDLAATMGVGMHGQKVARFEIPAPFNSAAEGDIASIQASFVKRAGQLGPGGDE